jgi:hypothetical protein
MRGTSRKHRKSQNLNANIGGTQRRASPKAGLLLAWVLS